MKEALFWLCKYVFLCLAIGVLCMIGYAWLDQTGRAGHPEDTAITVGSGWLVGESKECLSAPLNAEGAAQSGKPIGYAMSSVTCDGGPDHSMKVRFYGREIQAEYKTVSWRCVRNEVSFLDGVSFTCYQTGGATENKPSAPSPQPSSSSNFNWDAFPTR